MVSTIGPAKGNLIEANKKQAIPRARGKFMAVNQYLGISKARDIKNKIE